MQLGFVTAIVPELSLEEVLSLAAEEGFECIEAMCWPPGKAERKFAGVTHVDVTDFTQDQADDVLALCDKYGVRISSLGYYPNPLAGDDQEAEAGREHLRKVIRAAPMLGLDLVTTFIGADHRLSADDNLARYKQVWPDLIRHAGTHGVRLGIENCPMIFTMDEWPSGKNLARSPELWRRIFDDDPHGILGLNYDPSHLVWQMMDYIRPIYEFADRIFHVHAKDMRVEPSKLDECGIMGLGWSTPKIPGLGEVDWNRYVSALTDIGYDGPVCIEVEDDAFLGSLEARKRSLRLSRNVLRPLIV